MDYYLDLPDINLESTLFCGQAFRWISLGGNVFFGIADEKELTVRQESNGISLLSLPEKDISYWRNYFDADTDYCELVKKFSENEILKLACENSKGIRVLRQPPFETLISFIISQNNNITRITAIIKRLCEMFGKKTKNGYTFPTPSDLAYLEEEDLAPIRAGFRNRYILDAAGRVQRGDINLNALYEMPSEEAKKELMKIKGVGDKVADCVLLFAFSKTGSVPKDVWIKRALAQYFPDGLPQCVGEHGGIAQQFLFDYIRKCENV